MKKKHKLTPEAYKQICGLAESLPTLYKTDKQGRVLRTSTSKLMSGKEANEQESTDKYSEQKMYVRKEQVVQTVNHKVNLVTEWESKGQEGIDKYAANVRFIVEQAQKRDAEKQAAIDKVKEQVKELVQPKTEE